MKNEAVDFAIVGHQSSWHDILTLVNGMRIKNNNSRLALGEIKTLFPALPPRSLFDIEVKSTLSQKKIHGKYIETFISPDTLMDISSLRSNLAKVKKAAAVALEYGTPITSLGGFTSILLEGDMNYLPRSNTSKFTTGNTFTAALIVEGVKEACARLGKKPSESTLLIIGATGDLGSACARYFKPVFQTLLMAARNRGRLVRLARELKLPYTSTNLDSYVSQADVIISVASTKDLALTNLKQDVLIVDAGYPKNIIADKLPKGAYIFHAGMGQVSGEYSFKPDVYMDSYTFPLPNIGHGCVLEAAVLALENRIEAYSAGRGNITKENIKEIMSLATKNGIGLAPFFNKQGLWTTEVVEWYE